MATPSNSSEVPTDDPSVITTDDKSVIAKNDLSTEGTDEGGPFLVPDFSKMRSKVYTLFTWNKDKHVFRCKLCPSEYPYNKKSGGASLTNHVRRSHPDQATFLNNENQKRKLEGDNLTIFEQAAETGKKRPKSHCDLEKETCRKHLMNFIIATDQPFSLVEHSKFKIYVEYLSHGHEAAKLPSDKVIAKGVDTMYMEHEQLLKETLACTPGKVSFVIDGWTSKNQKAFLGVIARWIDKDWKLQNRVIGLTELHGSHTGANICKAFSDVIEKFNLWNKLHAITTDNAQNLDTFFDCLDQSATEKCLDIDIKSHRIRCMAHILNLACKVIIEQASGKVPDLHDDDEDMDNQVGSADFVGRIRKAVVGIRGSPQRREIFDKHCCKHILKSKELIRDVPTRWNSTYDMMQRAVELKTPLNDTLTSIRELRQLVISEEDWNKSQMLMELLRPFKDATVTLSCDHSPTLSDVSAVYQMLFDHLEKFTGSDYSSAPKKRRNRASNPTSGWIKVAADAGWNKLQEYYPTSDSDVNVIATILDPRLKLHWYKSVGWHKQWIDNAKKSITQIWKKYKPPEASSSDNSDRSTSVEKASPNAAKQNLFKSIFAQQMSEFHKTEDELKRYLSDGAVNPDALSLGGHGGGGSLGWWKMHANEYPNLSKMARDYLAASGSGVPVERFFSSGPDSLYMRRYRLKADTIRKLLCLKNWLRETSSKDGDSYVKSAVALKLGLEEEIPIEEDVVILE